MRPLVLALALVLVATGAVALAGGEQAASQDGDVIVTLAGGITPEALPRRELAPVGVRVAGDIKTTAADPAALPQVQRITVAINRQGRLFDRGLPTCRLGSIQPATEAVAKRSCGGAIVGNGRVTVQVRIPGQTPFSIRARLLAFNGPRKDGHKLIFAQAYARRPPGSFVLVFRVDKRDATLGTVLTTSLSSAARRWAYLTHFDMTLRRVYEFGGRERSFVSAACRAPEGFSTAVFPFAKAVYDFGEGRRLDVSLGGVCRAAD